MPSLPASIKRIGSKTTEKRWRHRFPHYKSMANFCCHGNQSCDPISPKTLCRLSATPVIKFGKLASEIFKFESVDDDGRTTTDGRTTASKFMCSITGGGERLHNVLRQTGYKLTLWAFGSGELKIHRCLSLKCQRPFSSKSRMQFTIWYPPFCQQFTNHRQKMLPNKHKTRFRNNSLFSDRT